MMPQFSAPFLIGASTKMYFTHRKTMDWCSRIKDIAGEHPATRQGMADVFVIPGYLSVPGALQLLQGTCAVGAQDVSTEDWGALTGEVSAPQLTELGAALVEVGHAERRRLFGDDEATVRAKTLAALRNSLVPLICIGEARQTWPEEAAAECIRQIDDALASARAAGLGGQIIAAYEPHWAIGAPEPASAEHIRGVAGPLREHLAASPDFSGSKVIYGGSAGPGLLTTISDAVDGLFLGRFAHDPEAVRDILDEVAKISGEGSHHPRRPRRSE